MPPAKFPITDPQPRVVGSFGSALDLGAANATEVGNCCDLAEIRLDLLALGGGDITSELWKHLLGVPLLFTARRREEGGALDLTASARMALLQPALKDAACVDVEVASIQEMAAILREIAELEIPWIASYHDFTQLPDSTVLERAAQQAKAAGAAVFKVAAKLASPADVARLAEFQLADHGIPVSTMGMGPLAPVSRLLCAQSGSRLNYGYLGGTATAPGQWDSALLKTALSRLVSIRP